MSDRPVAMITGGARRVGAAIARELARAGCDVIITARTGVAQAEALAGELRQGGAAARVLALDLSDAAAIEAAARGLVGELQRLDVLIHNASLYAPSPLAALRADEALEHYRVNALAPLVLSARLAPLLARSRLIGGGAIVAMLDMHALGRPRRDYSAYSMSKAALAEMVRCLARDLAPSVRVNGVAPGVVAWPEAGPESDDASQRAYLARVPLARAGTPEDAARAVRWLALEASYVTGEIVRVDGGRWLA